MKYIEKTPSPDFFEGWKQRFQEQHGSQPTYHDLKGQVKARLKQYLLEEQGYLCCYCMANIEVTSDSSHLEHFIPRADGRNHPHSLQFQDVELGYQNLFLSCNGEWCDESHCGKYKDSTTALMLVSPASTEVQDAFSYTVSGDIDGTTPKAMTSVRVLNLQSAALKRHRKTAIWNSGFFDDDFPDEKDALIELYSSKDSDGKFTPFCEAILFVMKNA